MATTVSITKILKESDPSGAGAAFVTNRILVFWSDGSIDEHADLAAFQEYARGFESVDTAKRMACARLIALSPDLKNTSQVVGKDCTLDPSSVSMFKVQ